MASSGSRPHSLASLGAPSSKIVTVFDEDIDNLSDFDFSDLDLSDEDDVNGGVGSEKDDRHRDRFRDDTNNASGNGGGEGRMLSLLEVSYSRDIRYVNSAAHEENEKTLWTPPGGSGQPSNRRRGNSNKGTTGAGGGKSSRKKDKKPDLSNITILKKESKEPVEKINAVPEVIEKESAGKTRKAKRHDRKGAKQQEVVASTFEQERPRLTIQSLRKLQNRSQASKDMVKESTLRATAPVFIPGIATAEP